MIIRCLSARSPPIRRHSSSAPTATSNPNSMQKDQDRSGCDGREGAGRLRGSWSFLQGVNITKFPSTSPAVMITAATCSTFSIRMPRPWGFSCHRRTLARHGARPHASTGRLDATSLKSTTRSPSPSRSITKRNPFTEPDHSPSSGSALSPDWSETLVSNNVQCRWFQIFNRNCL